MVGIPLLVLHLLLVFWASRAACEILTREIQPERRRDLTLAVADDGESLTRRVLDRQWRAVRGASLALGAWLLACAVAAVVVPAMTGVLVAGMIAPFAAFILLHFSLPGIVVAACWVARRACRRNAEFSPLGLGFVWLAGVLWPVALAVYVVVAVSLLAFLEGLFDLLFFPLTVVVALVAIAAFLASIFAFSWLLVALPSVAYEALRREYPYFEE